MKKTFLLLFVFTLCLKNIFLISMDKSFDKNSFVEVFRENFENAENRFQFIQEGSVQYCDKKNFLEYLKKDRAYESWATQNIINNDEEAIYDLYKEISVPKKEERSLDIRDQIEFNIKNALKINTCKIILPDNISLTINKGRDCTLEITKEHSHKHVDIYGFKIGTLLNQMNTIFDIFSKVEETTFVKILLDCLSHKNDLKRSNNIRVIMKNAENITKKMSDYSKYYSIMNFYEMHLYPLIVILMASYRKPQENVDIKIDSYDLLCEQLITYINSLEKKGIIDSYIHKKNDIQYTEEIAKQYLENIRKKMRNILILKEEYILEKKEAKDLDDLYTEYQNVSTLIEQGIARESTIKNLYDRKVRDYLNTLSLESLRDAKEELEQYGLMKKPVLSNNTFKKIIQYREIKSLKDDLEQMAQKIKDHKCILNAINDEKALSEDDANTLIASIGEIKQLSEEFDETKRLFQLSFSGVSKKMNRDQKIVLPDIQAGTTKTLDELKIEANVISESIENIKERLEKNIEVLEPYLTLHKQKLEDHSKKNVLKRWFTFPNNTIRSKRITRTLLMTSLLVGGFIAIKQMKNRFGV